MERRNEKTCKWVVNNSISFLFLIHFFVCYRFYRTMKESTIMYWTEYIAFEHFCFERDKTCSFTYGSNFKHNMANGQSMYTDTIIHFLCVWINSCTDILYTSIFRLFHFLKYKTRCVVYFFFFFSIEILNSPISCIFHLCIKLNLYVHRFCEFWLTVGCISSIQNRRMTCRTYFVLVLALSDCGKGKRW